MIKDRFPSLSTLILTDISCDQSLEALFGQLPDFLETLSLKYLAGNHPDIQLSSLAALPRNLKALTLRRCWILEPREDDFFDFGGVLPPNLTHLDLEELCIPTILNYLPSPLRYLRFELDGRPNDFSWEEERLPLLMAQILIPLMADISPHVNLNSLTPTLLETFEFGEKNCHQIDSANIDQNPYEAITNLPTEIEKQIQFYGNNSRSCHENIFRKFPNLEQKSIHSHSMPLSSLPRGLKALRILVPIIFDHPLPPGLTMLDMCVPSTVTNISSTLKHLSVRSDSAVSLFDAEDYYLTLKSRFPPWNASDFSQLASFARLESLSIDWEYVESPSSLAPLSKIETLTFLALRTLKRDQSHEMPQWVPKCLPRNLKSLALSFSVSSPPSGDDNDEKDFSSDFLRLCNLSEVTPTLKYLQLHISLRRFPVFWTEECFASLPKGLLFLNLRTIVADLALGAVAKLPRTLKYFNLSLSEPIRTSISNEHFLALPEKLSELYLLLGQTTTIDDQLLEIIPKSVLKLESRGNRFARAVEEKFTKQLEENPLCKGFLHYYRH